MLQYGGVARILSVPPADVADWATATLCHSRGVACRRAKLSDISCAVPFRGLFDWRVVYVRVCSSVVDLVVRSRWISPPCAVIGNGVEVGRDRRFLARFSVVAAVWTSGVSRSFFTTRILCFQNWRLR